MTSPALLRAAQAIWDRGRTTQPAFDALSPNQRADLIADAAAVIRSLLCDDGRRSHWNRAILAILGESDRNLDSALGQSDKSVEKPKQRVSRHVPSLQRANVRQTASQRRQAIS